MAAQPWITPDGLLPYGRQPGIKPFGHRSRPYVCAQGSVTAPRSAPVTRRAYLANTPVL
jgi:hypothetical protein